MSTPSTTPAPPGTDPSPAVRSADRWRAAGLAVLAVWAVLLGLAVALWVRFALFGGSGEDVHGYIRVFGAPFVLLALGLLWWVWRSARHLRHRRPAGWTLPIALGGVALVQSFVTTLPLALSAASGAGGSPDDGSGPGWDAAAPFLAGLVLGAVSLVVGLLGRRSWALVAADGGSDVGEGTDVGGGTVTGRG